MPAWVSWAALWAMTSYADGVWGRGALWPRLVARDRRAGGRPLHAYTRAAFRSLGCQGPAPTAFEGSSHRSLKPFPGAGSAVRAARPTTRAAFPCPELLDRALDSAGARRFLFGRDDPTNPFVSRQRRQILPGRLRRGLRAEGRAHICRGFVHGCRSGLALYHLALPGGDRSVNIACASNPSACLIVWAAAAGALQRRRNGQGASIPVRAM